MKAAAAAVRSPDLTHVPPEATWTASASSGLSTIAPTPSQTFETLFRNGYVRCVELCAVVTATQIPDTLTGYDARTVESSISGINVVIGRLSTLADDLWQTRSNAGSTTTATTTTATTRDRPAQCLTFTLAIEQEVRRLRQLLLESVVVRHGWLNAILLRHLAMEWKHGTLVTDEILRDQRLVESMRRQASYARTGAMMVASPPRAFP